METGSSGIEVGGPAGDTHEPQDSVGEKTAVQLLDSRADQLLERKAAQLQLSSEESLANHDDQTAVTIFGLKSLKESPTSAVERGKLPIGSCQTENEQPTRPARRCRKRPSNDDPYDRDPSSPYLYIAEAADRPVWQSEDPEDCPLRKQIKVEPVAESYSMSSSDSLSFGNAFSLASVVFTENTLLEAGGGGYVKQELEELDEEWSTVEEVITSDLSVIGESSDFPVDPLEDPLSTCFRPPMKPFSWPLLDPLFLTQIDFRLPKEFAPFLRALAKPTAEILPLVQEPLRKDASQQMSSSTATSHSHIRKSSQAAAAVKPAMPVSSRSPALKSSQATGISSASDGGPANKVAEPSASQLRRSARQTAGRVRSWSKEFPPKPDLPRNTASEKSMVRGASPSAATGTDTMVSPDRAAMLSALNKLPVFSSGEVTIMSVGAADPAAQRQTFARVVLPVPSPQKASACSAVTPRAAVTSQTSSQHPTSELKPGHSNKMSPNIRPNLVSKHSPGAAAAVVVSPQYQVTMRLTGRSISRRNVVPPLHIKLGTATQPNQILPLVPSKRHAILATKNRLKRRISRSAARGGNDCTAESSQPTRPSSQSSKASAGVEESAGAKDRRSVRQSARQRWGNTADAPSTAAEGAVEVRNF